jgi:hypothetical protein
LLSCERKAAVGSEYPSFAETRSQIVLYSWLDKGRDLFAFVPKEKADTFLDHFSPSHAGVELEMTDFEIKKLPKNSVILWREFAPKGMKYPSKDVMKRIKKTASECGIEVQITPTIYD